MDKATCRRIHQEMDAALTAVAAKHGFTYIPGNMSYDDGSATGRVKFVEPEAAIAVTNERFRINGVDLKVGDLVEIIGTRYSISGLTERGRVIAKRFGDGKMVAFPTDMLLKLPALKVKS